jgi:hypothetical protein
MRIASISSFLAVTLWLGPASAQTTPTPDRSVPWQTVTSITTVAAMGTQVLMPRVFYAEPETTVGWRARWHVSALAPTMTLTALTLLNEYSLKDTLGSYRPACDQTNQGTTHCTDYESLSSHSFAAFSAFGHGTAVFLIDTTKWSDGRFNAGSLVGDVVVPVILASVTAVGRSAGNWESSGTVVLSSGVGLAFGALTGITYALLQRPGCPYESGLICW